jgi:hypothetical protein
MLGRTITLGLLLVGNTLPTEPPELTVTSPSMNDGNSPQLTINSNSARHEQQQAKGVQSTNDLSSSNQEKDHGKSAMLPGKLGEQPDTVQEEHPKALEKSERERDMSISATGRIEEFEVHASDVLEQTTNSKITPMRMKINGIWYNRKDSMKAELGRFGRYRSGTVGQPSRYDLQSWAPIYWTATPPPTSTQNPYWSPVVLFSAENMTGTGNIVTGDTVVIDTETANDLTLHANLSLGAGAGNSLGAATDDSIGLNVNSGLQLENEYTAGYALQQFYFKDEGVIIDWINAEPSQIGNAWDAVQRDRIKALNNAARIVTTMWLLVGVNSKYETSSHCSRGELSVSASNRQGSGSVGIGGSHCDVRNVLFNGDTIMAYQMSSIDWEDDIAVSLKTRTPGN